MHDMSTMRRKIPLKYFINDVIVDLIVGKKFI